MINFATNLKQLRKHKELSQEQVADYLSLTRAAYTKYELSNAEPTLTRLVQLADLFEVSLDDLVGRSKTIDNKDIFKIMNEKQVELNIKKVTEQVIESFISDHRERISEAIIREAYKNTTVK